MYISWRMLGFLIIKVFLIHNISVCPFDFSINLNQWLSPLLNKETFRTPSWWRVTRHNFFVIYCRLGDAIKDCALVRSTLVSSNPNIRFVVWGKEESGKSDFNNQGEKLMIVTEVINKALCIQLQLHIQCFHPPAKITHSEISQIFLW